MGLHEDIDELLRELAEENTSLRQAVGHEQEVEALKDMLDVFMRGTQSVREHIDRFNERRWRR
jgi:hypothetical protein